MQRLLRSCTGLICSDEANQGSVFVMKVLSLGRKSFVHQLIQGTDWSENSFAKMNLGFLVNSKKVDMSQQGTLVVKLANSILCCIGEQYQQAEGGDPSSPLSSTEAHLEYQVQLWACLWARDVDMLQ